MSEETRKGKYAEDATHSTSKSGSLAIVQVTSTFLLNKAMNLIKTTVCGYKYVSVGSIC